LTRHAGLVIILNVAVEQLLITLKKDVDEIMAAWYII
jgi:hypothetical protein